MMQRTFSDVYEVQQLTELDPHFYDSLSALEQQHAKGPTPQSLDLLLKHYTDCIHYHDHIDEPVSFYFQHKLKKLIVQRNQSIRQRQLSDRKNKLLLNSISRKPGSLQVQNHQQQITEQSHQQHKQDQYYEPVVDAASRQLDTITNYQKKISSIIDQQKEQLLSRRRKMRKCLTKSASATVSFDSLFDSPQAKSSGKVINTLNLFESLIDQNEEQ